MAANRFIEEQYGRDICRRCINRLFHVHLKPTDCLYGLPFPQRCRACGEMRNIVTGLRLSGKMKLFGKKPV